jgi:DNA helicase II / ATP-dependent DNA helicase PcrA
VPARGIGDKTLTELFARADKANVSAFALAEKICDGKTPDIKPPVKKKLTKFVAIIQELRTSALAVSLQLGS